MEVTIPESVVQQGLRTLEGGGRTSHDMNDGDVFTVSTGNTIESRKFTDAYNISATVMLTPIGTEGSDNSSDALDTCMAVCRIGSIELIASD